MALMDERTPGVGTLPVSKGQMPPRGQAGSRGQSGPRGQNQPHKCNLINREIMMVTGVNDVLAFDVSEVLLETALGMLSIRGSDLHVNRLTLEKGEVDVTGKIDSLTYSDVGTYRKQGESLWHRLFR